MSGFVAAYTVQPGDTDTDGVYIGAQPIGDNASAEVESAYVGLDDPQIYSMFPRTCYGRPDNWELVKP